MSSLTAPETRRGRIKKLCHKVVDRLLCRFTVLGAFQQDAGVQKLARQI